MSKESNRNSHSIKFNKLLKFIHNNVVALIADTAVLSILSATLIGIAAGISALCLEYGAFFLSQLRLSLCNSYPAWIVLPCYGFCGGLISGYLVQKYSPTAFGSGIPQVRAYLLGAKVPLDFKLAIIKLFAGIIALGSGLFLGREGPTVHVGAAIAAHLNKLWPNSINISKQLVAAGAGAGLAAAFNAPIAGVLFVAEELLKDISTNTMGTAILVCFMASVFTHVFDASHINSAGKGHEAIYIFSWKNYLFWGLIGISSGIFGSLFSKGILFVLRLYRDFIKLPVCLRVAFAGFLSGVIIALVPSDAHFQNYSTLKDLIITGQEPTQMTCMAFVLFFMLTLLAYGSGAPGGLFAPTLLLGSSLGAIVASIEKYFFGSTNIEAMSIVGMSAFFAAVARVPITAVVIIFEITGHYSLILPLMIATVIAYFVATKIDQESVYDKLRHWSGLE